MDRVLKQFRREAKARANQRYSQRLRKLACGYTDGRIRQGEAIAVIAQQLGVAEQTLRNWLKRAGSDFLKVRLTESAAKEQSEKSRLVLISPTGYRVEGLDVRGMSELLRVLR
jgi:transposase-like protein